MLLCGFLKSKTSPSVKPNRYPSEPLINKGNFPDPLKIPGGKKIRARSDWPKLADFWRKTILKTEYGGLPPAPKGFEIEILCHSTIRRFEGAPKLFSYKVHLLGGKKPFNFSVRILLPASPGPHPAIVNGDGCWWYISDEIAQSVIRSGCALVMFNRTEFAEDQHNFAFKLEEGMLPEGFSQDPGRNRRSGGIYDFAGTRAFGAVSAWAYGYMRCIDFLEKLPFIDCSKIAVSGHSRGGKTTLLAGALDERIALVNDNASCAGGSALFRYVGHDGETIDICNQFPSWFGSGLKKYCGREEELPFDQHCLLSCIAPRPLLLTYALDDRWSNPEGMVRCVEATRPVYRFLGAEDRLQFHLREGIHRHDPEDWAALLDFIRWQWQGRKPRRQYSRHPYRHLADL